MLYKSFVLKLVPSDVGMFLFFEIVFLFALWLIRLLPETRKYTYSAFFFALMGIAVFVFDWPRLVDAWHYFQEGDAYLREKVCLVQSVESSFKGRLIFGEQNVRCINGDLFSTHSIRKPLTLEKRQDVFLYYLPRSKVIVEIQARNGDILWSGASYWKEEEGSRPWCLSVLLILLGHAFVRYRVPKQIWNAIRRKLRKKRWWKWKR